MRYPNPWIGRRFPRRKRRSRLLNLNLFGDVLRLLIGFEATSARSLARSPSSSSTPTHSPPPNRIDHTTLTNNDHSTATRTSLSLPPPTNSAAASAAAAVDQELSLPTWVIFIIIVAIICAALAAFTFVVLPFLRHGHDTDEASDDEDDYVEDVAPPYEEIPLIAAAVLTEINATSGALKSPPYERVIPIQTRSREHPTPTSVSWPTPVHNDDDDDSSSSEQSLSDFDYDSFPAPPPPVFVPLDPSHPPALMPRQEIGSLELRFPVPGSYNPETKTYQTETQVIRGTDVKVPHLKTLFPTLQPTQNEEGWAFSSVVPVTRIETLDRTHLQQSEVHMKKTTATLNGIQQFLSQFQQQSPFGPTVVDDPPVSAEPPSPNAQRLSTLEELPADPFSRFGNELGVLDVLDSLGLVVRRLVERLFRIFRYGFLTQVPQPRLLDDGPYTLTPLRSPPTRYSDARSRWRAINTLHSSSNPPVLKFCIGNPRANVLALATMWTDEPGWPWHTNPDADNQRKRLPTVNGHPIPLKYWPTLYKNVTGSKNQIWAKTKAHWSDWRFLMDYWEHSQNDETFWGMLQYPDRITGQLVDPSINEIHKALREARKSRDSEDFKRARLEYSEADFGRFFNRRGTAVTLTREDHVGARYREFYHPEGKEGIRGGGICGIIRL
ncbi:hypothetical protein B0H14DRAFT_3763846 [Mycena olivaceomarginata]|nr:hypothetical protein B0H14DRAFT_3763846 [Mycena olivaceomarginata]